MLPAMELLMDTGAGAGIPGHGCGLRAGRAAALGSPRWTRPGHCWQLGRGATVQLALQLEWDGAGTSLHRRLGVPSRRGEQDGLHCRGHQELGHRTHSTPSEGPRCASMETGLTLGSLHRLLFGLTWTEMLQAQGQPGPQPTVVPPKTCWGKPAAPGCFLEATLVPEGSVGAAARGHTVGGQGWKGLRAAR